EDAGRAEALALDDGPAGPHAGVDVGGELVGVAEVERDHDELKAGTTLEEEDLVGVGDPEDVVAQPLGAAVDRLVGAAAVRDLEDRHADAGAVAGVAVLA